MIAASAVCFGLMPLFVRELQGLGMTGAKIALYRFGFSAVFLVPFLPFDRQKRGSALLLTGTGVVLGLSLIGYLDAINAAPVAAAGVIYMTYPVFAVLFAWMLLRQPFARRSFLAAGLVLGAAALLLDPSSLSPDVFKVLLWAIPMPVAMGFAIVVLIGLSGRLTSLERAACALSGSVLGLLPMVFVEGQGAILPASPREWTLIVLMGLATALGPQLLYTFACQAVGPVRSAAAGSVELPVMFALGWLVFGEAVGIRELVSASLVLSAILVAPAIRPRLPRDNAVAAEVSLKKVS